MISMVVLEDEASSDSPITESQIQQAYCTGKVFVNINDKKVIGNSLVDFTRRLVAHRMRRQDIKSDLEKTTSITFSDESLDGVVAASIRVMYDRLKAEKNIHRAEALALYEECISDANSSWRDKLAAQQGILELLGLVEVKQQSGGMEVSQQRVREILKNIDLTTEAK
jgi:hypothetical protein